MKKTLILLLSALAALLLVSCGDAIEIPDVNGSGNTPSEVTPVPPLAGDVVFTATAEDLADGSGPVWVTGETIFLSDGTTVQTLTNRASDGQVAEFPGKVTEGKTSFVAAYPAAEGVTFDGTTVTFDLPTRWRRRPEPICISRAWTPRSSSPSALKVRRKSALRRRAPRSPAR